MHAQRFPFVAAILVAVLVSGVTVVPGQEPGTRELSSIVGRVTAGEGKSAVAGATVVAYHLSTAQVYRSSVTTSNGKFQIDGLPHGYYDLAIETPEGLHVANQVVNVPPMGKAVANLQLLPASLTGEGPRDFPGSDQAATGIAQMLKKGKKKGLAILAGAGGAAALALAAGGGDGKKKPSPSAPPN